MEAPVRPSALLKSNRAAIRQIVKSHRAGNVRVFGSALRGKDTTESDLDLVVDPTPETTLMDIGAIRHEISHLLGIEVDVVTPNALPESFRSLVLAQARRV